MLSTIAVLGVGRVGASVARTALQAGISVNIAASGPAEDIALLAEIVIPGATAMTAADAVARADLVVLALPLHKYRSIDPGPLQGKVVIDAMNHWAPIDGDLVEFRDDPRGTSEIVAAHLVDARVVKTLNHIGYHELEDDARRDTVSDRRALAYASDDAGAAASVHELIDRFGFDPIDAGPLAAGAAFEAGTTIFASRLDADEMRTVLAEAVGISADAAHVAQPAG